LELNEDHKLRFVSFHVNVAEIKYSWTHPKYGRTTITCMLVSHNKN
jgi:hypothetical protein